jgi:CRISPR-associated protein Cas8b1/Cst1 subtype I-B
MQLDLTGNPFVDTGLLTISAHLAENMGAVPLPLTTELVSEAMSSNEGFGRWLAKANRQLKSFFMVVGTNSPLVNPSNNKQMNKGKNYGFLHEDDTGWKTYVNILESLQNELSGDVTKQQVTTLCEACGERYASQVINPIGRDFFPLAGSLGNDAQALPAASRAPKLCPLCLIAIQWLPLGTCIFNRGLACFQFTEPILSQEIIRGFYQENRGKLDSSPDTKKIPILFSTEDAKSQSSGRSLGYLLFERIRRLKESKADYEISDDVSLNIWVFSNAGQSPDCEVYEIPNPSLQFLWEGLKHHYELSKLLAREDPKKPSTHLLSAIERKIEYSGFYPQKLKKGQDKPDLASIKLYDLYQTKILNRPTISLESAKQYANLAYELLSLEANQDKKKKKFLEQVLKENPRWVKEPQVRIELRKLIAIFAEEGQLIFDHYVSLFPAANLEGIANLTTEQSNAIWQKEGAALRPTKAGWDLFWFYFHHAANGTLEVSSDTMQSKLAEEELNMFTNPKVKQFAKDVFELHLQRRGGSDLKRGLSFIKKNILDAFTGKQIKASTLQNWFALLGEQHEGYANEDFDALCRDEWGNLAVYELLFQMRLEMANLYRAASQKLETQNS